MRQSGFYENTSPFCEYVSRICPCLNQQSICGAHHTTFPALASEQRESKSGPIRDSSASDYAKGQIVFISRII
jgi:hypothetical protein